MDRQDPRDNQVLLVDQDLMARRVLGVIVV